MKDDFSRDIKFLNFQVHDFVGLFSKGTPHKNTRFGPWLEFVSALLRSTHETKTTKGSKMIICRCFSIKEFIRGLSLMNLGRHPID